MGRTVASRRAAVASADAWEPGWADGSGAPTRVTISLQQLAERIRTGCVYEEQPEGTFGLLVTRDDPRSRRRSRVIRAPIDAYWAALSPSARLLTGRDAGCRARRCRGSARHAGHLDGREARPRLGWEGFVAAYRAELEACPEWKRLGIVRHVARWLESHRTLTILSFEPGMPRGEALAAWERYGAFAPWAQRHVFRDWLLDLPPLVVLRPGAAAPQER